ncbi:MAG: TIGR00297 family protein [Halobacteriota archaeon]|nr:TIGR00297 family protein [Halobacteriota archaeon]
MVIESGASFYIAILFVFIVGYISYKMRLLDKTGTFCGILIGVLMVLFTDGRWFLVLLLFFILGGVSTKYKQDYKRTLGIIQGTRDYGNVLGNGLIALCMTLAFSFDDMFLIGFLGAVAAATADTLATEIGDTSNTHPRLITNFKPVRPGTNGAISPLGELSALLGSAIIALFGISMGLHNGVILTYIAVVAGGFIGANFDSLLGATLEDRGFLTNNTVNLFGTLMGSLSSVAFFVLIS